MTGSAGSRKPTVRVSRIEEIEEIDDGRCPMRPIRHHLGISAFGVNSWTAREAGDRIINEHDEGGEDGDEELYLVFEGRATFTLDGEEVDAPAGTLVFVRPNVTRTAVAREPQTTLLAIGGVPGRTYVPSGWELWAPANRHYEAGDYAAAIEAITPALERYPRYPGLFYNVACCESLAGRAADAISHLGHAVAVDDRFRSFARDDGDFDPLRDEPAFRELVGES
jgi:tetratricopeptide (TPR) repeat protein